MQQKRHWLVKGDEFRLIYRMGKSVFLRSGKVMRCVLRLLNLIYVQCLVAQVGTSGAQPKAQDLDLDELLAYAAELLSLAIVTHVLLFPAQHAQAGRLGRSRWERDEAGSHVPQKALVTLQNVCFAGMPARSRIPWRKARKFSQQNWPSASDLGWTIGSCACPDAFVLGWLANLLAMCCHSSPSI